MKWTLRLVYIILFIFISLPIRDKDSLYLASFSDPIPNGLPMLRQPSKEGAWEVLLKEQNQWKEIALPLPFLDYSPKGMVINYNDDGNLFIIDNNSIEDFSSESIINGFFPKIIYPFILLLDKDRAFMKLARLHDNNLELLKSFAFSNIVSAYSSSSNGRYIIMGTLSNNIFIFDTQNIANDPKTLSIPFSYDGIYAVGIRNNGFYFVLGSHNPSAIAYGNIEETDSSLHFMSLSHPIWARKQSFIESSHLFFVSEQYKLEPFKIKDNKLLKNPLSSLRPYPLVNVKEIGQKLYLIYRLSSLEYVLDLLDLETGNLLFKYHLLTSTIPIFTSISKNKKEISIILEGQKAWVL